MELFAKRTTSVPSLTATFAFVIWTKWKRWHFYRNIHEFSWQNMKPLAKLAYRNHHLFKIILFTSFFTQKWSIFSAFLKFKWNFRPFAVKLIEILMFSLEFCSEDVNVEMNIGQVKEQNLCESLSVTVNSLKTYFEHIFVTVNCLSNDISSWCQGKSS